MPSHKVKTKTENPHRDNPTPYKKDRYPKLEGRIPVCVLCLVGHDEGDKDSSGGRHHIFSRSRLPGDENEALLWNPVNIAHACIRHHERYGNRPDLWVKAMIELGYAQESDYAPYLEKVGKRSKNEYSRVS